MYTTLIVSHSLSLSTQQGIQEKICGLTDLAIWEKETLMLKKVDLVKGFDYNVLKDVEFCESCVSGKLIALPFQSLVEKEQKNLMVLFIVNCEARSANHHSAKLNT